MEWSAPVECRFDGRELHGVVVRYNDVSESYREMFAPGAFGALPPAVPLRIEHDKALTIASAPVAGDMAGVSLRCEIPDGIRTLVRNDSLRGLSCEFVAKRQHRDSNGIRVIEQAELRGVGLVSRPAYRGSTIELRSTKMALMNAGIAPRKRHACECSGSECHYASFTEQALEEEAASINAGRDVVAFWGDYSNPLGSTAKGTVRVSWQADGETGSFDIAIDLPDNDTGRRVVDAAADSGVVVRPYLDQQRSIGQRIGEVMAYSAIFVRGFQVSATDSREGWPEPEITLREKMALNEGLLTEEELELLEQNRQTGDDGGPMFRAERRRVWL